MSNTIGQIFRLTTFGESHGEVVGGVIDGCPAGLCLDMNLIQQELDRRRPSRELCGTARHESDEVRFLSGVYEGRTIGAPIAFVVENKDVRSKDYSLNQHTFRPGHADYTYYSKYDHVDYRGGGRASARETVVRVVAGAIAKQLLLTFGIEFVSCVNRIGGIGELFQKYSFEQLKENRNFPLSPDNSLAQYMKNEIAKASAEGDSVGGSCVCVVRGVPVGIGEPLYDKLQARLAYAMLSIPACKGFDYGEGFNAATMRGSENNDAFVASDGRVSTKTNHCGGILGGISTGNDISFRVAFKPTPTIAIKQQTVTDAGEQVEASFTGRHDACVAVRALPVVEAMAAITILDLMLLRNTNTL